MEIKTTVKDFSEHVKQYHLPPDAPIRVIVGDFQQQVSSFASNTKVQKEAKSKYPFLHSEVWDQEGGEADIAENHDHYLYDLDQ